MNTIPLALHLSQHRPGGSAVLPPVELRRLNQWVPADQDGNHCDVNRIGLRALVSDPETWTSYGEASSWLNHTPALCVHRDNGLVLLDVDCCVSPLQNLSSFSSELLERFDGAYVELSGSGYGLHIVARGVLPSGYRHVVRVGGFPRGRKQAQLEVYHDRKFLRITGAAIRNPDRIGDCQDGLDWLYRILLKPLERPHLDTPSLPVREDATVLGALRRVRGFNELYEHGAGPGDDHSALDWRLICLIVEHGTRDAEQAADIFRQSALYRPSGKGPRYIETTVEKALRRTGWKSAMGVAV